MSSMINPASLKDISNQIVFDLKLKSLLRSYVEAYIWFQAGYAMI